MRRGRWVDGLLRRRKENGKGSCTEWKKEGGERERESDVVEFFRLPVQYLRLGHVLYCREHLAVSTAVREWEHVIYLALPTR